MEREIIGNSMEVIIQDIKDHLDLGVIEEGEEDFNYYKKYIIEI